MPEAAVVDVDAPLPGDPARVDAELVALVDVVVDQGARLPRPRRAVLLLGVNVDAGAYSLFPDFAHGLKPAAPAAFSFDFGFVASHVIDFVFIVFSFLFVDLFDTSGTLIGVAAKGNLLDENGKLPKAGRALMSDAVGTTQ